MKRLVAIVLVCLIGAGILVVGVKLLDVTDGKTPSHDIESVSLLSESSVVERLEFEPIHHDYSEEPLASPLYLGHECPDLLSDEVRSDERCMDAIERDLMGKAAYVVEEPYMVPREGQFTYRTMFDNFQRDRELALEALARPECRLLDGPIRTDLKETCNAEAFYRLAVLKELCSSAKEIRTYFKPREDDLAKFEFLRREYPVEFNRLLAQSERMDFQHLDELVQELSSKYGNDVSFYTLSKYESNFKTWEDRKDEKPPRTSQREWDENEGWYYAWRNRTRRLVLRSVWLDSSGMCPMDLVDWQLPKGSQDTVSEELQNWWNDSKENLWKKHPFMEIAARLGFEHLTFTRYRFTDIHGSDFSKSVSEMYPWRMQLGHSLLFSGRDLAEQVFGAAHGFVGMRRDGFEPDFESWVRNRCSLDTIELERGFDDCAAAIRKAEAMLDASAIEELRVLDEIEQVALKLGLYQYR